MKEGIVNLLKPPGMTSSDAVADVRHIFNIKRVGHTGTLDPGAAGVLPICVGRATRLFDILVDKQKEYLAEICFGRATDTQDSYGAVTEELPGADVRAETVLNALPPFMGEIEQTAPMYSAVSLDGKRLYQLAREGAAAVELKRRISVATLELMEQTGKNRFLLRIVCSRGTYIRTLCHDIGRSIGTPAYMSFLLRTRSGEFTIENTFTIARLREMKEEGALLNALIPIEETLSSMAEVRLNELDERQSRLLRNGAEILCPKLADAGEGALFRVYDGEEFLGIGEHTKNGALHIKLNLGRTEV